MTAALLLTIRLHPIALTISKGLRGLFACALAILLAISTLCLTVTTPATGPATATTALLFRTGLPLDQSGIGLGIDIIHFAIGNGGEFGG